jgi:hypothetical protein
VLGRRTADSLADQFRPIFELGCLLDVPRWAATVVPAVKYRLQHGWGLLFSLLFHFETGSLWREFVN